LKTLIIEFFATGHYPEYLKHVLDHLNKRAKYSEYIIFLSTRLKDRVTSFKNTPVYTSIHFFNEAVSLEFSAFESTKRMSDFMLNQIFEIKKFHDFNHVLFLNLNFFLLQRIALNPFKKLPFSFSGIFFNSPYRSRKYRKDKIGVWKKELVLRLLSVNKNCKSIYLLNDKKGAAYYSKWSSKIKYIVDPVLITTPSDIDIYKEHNIDNDAVTFGHIGYLGSYKGTFDVIEGILGLQSLGHSKAVFLFVGKMLKDLKSNFNQLTKTISPHNLKIKEGFVTNDDLMAYVEQVDVILIANKNVLATSGIVNHVLSHNKVVIAPDKGYFKEVFSDYEAALLFNDKFSLMDAIIYATDNIKTLKDKAILFDSQQHIKINSGEVFSDTLLNA
jgi:glycosyltransferase involved in cell wall biosynthesis